MTTSLWRGDAPLVLASGSATRRMMLEQAGLAVEVQAPDVDERAVEAPLVAAGATLATVALALARAKARAVSAVRPGRLVLGGDQTLALGERAFHKPSDARTACHQIAALAGATHRLESAAALVRDGVVLFETVGTASLTMRPLSREFIAAYVEAAGPGVCDSVGGYKLEGLGIHLFERIEGEHATILGLPLLALLDALRGLGMLAG
jgi:septum formation protein